jgi:predicted RNase H-like nuclease (RuvC/YqgF family)
MTFADLIDLFQNITAALIAGGVIGGIVTIWTSRHKPPLERQAANDATRKSYADVFSTEITTMRTIIDELKKDRAEMREESKQMRVDFEEQINDLRQRTACAEQRARESERSTIKLSQLYDLAASHIERLEDHINDKLGPPPPPRPAPLQKAPKITPLP